MPPSARMRTPWFCLTVGLWLEQEGFQRAATLGLERVISSVPGGPGLEGTSRSCVTLPLPLPLCPGDEVYSTIRKQEYNGKITRFRRIKGDSELYTSDTVMQSESSSGWAGLEEEV